MFEEVNEIIKDYDRDKRPRAEELYNDFFQELQSIDADVTGLPEGYEGRSELLKEMKEIAEKMQELNYAVCAFEHDRVSVLADECPPRHEYGSSSGVDADESAESLLAWLMLHFPHTWPR